MRLNKIYDIESQKHNGKLNIITFDCYLCNYLKLYI